jgi:hypothetical protein
MPGTYRLMPVWHRRPLWRVALPVEAKVDRRELPVVSDRTRRLYRLLRDRLPVDAIVGALHRCIARNTPRAACRHIKVQLFWSNS